jgi:UDP-4-amino-4,6-dideoxy-N-acetyl-beta-L-altrosamine transaminase
LLPVTRLEAAPYLPYGRHCIDEDDIAAVAAVLKSARLTSGPAVERFEAALAAVTGAPFAVACASGTAALHLAMLALGLGPRSTVIVPAITFAATANAARYVGARVHFADVDPESGLMRPADLEAALHSLGRQRAQAALPVHLGGQVADPLALARIADRHGLKIVEDACHALGTSYVSDRSVVPVGACAHACLTAFSFHAVKTVAMGEGGALTTRDAALAARLKRLRNHGAARTSQEFTLETLAFDSKGRPNPWYYELGEIGFNYRASDIACALGESQLKKLARFVGERRRIVARYEGALAPLAPAIRPLARMPGCTPAWHLLTVLIDFARLGLERAELMARLDARGIGTQVHYIPLHLHPYYRRHRAEAGDKRPLPGAEAYYARALSLPLFVGMSECDVARVVDALAVSAGLSS